MFGTSVTGRPLIALWSGHPHPPRRILVVGVIHGDEAAGLPIALALSDHPVLPSNFPYHWAPIGHPGDQQYSGATSLSEPESRAMAALIVRFRPTITIWFHQPVGVVDESGGAFALERRFADLLGEPLRRLPRYPGSAETWQNNLLPGSSAFAVELPHHVGSALRSRAVLALRDLEG